MQFSAMSRVSPSPIHDRLTEVISESTSQAPQPESATIPRSTEGNLYVLGIPLHKTSPLFQLLFSITGIMVFYLLYGYVQEWIFHIDGFKPYGWYLTLVQFGCYSLFGVSEMWLTGAFGNRLIPLHVYGFIAFLTVATIGLSNTSLGYLNYPTQVIFKSCKLIPVMLGGVVIQGKRYGILDVIAILCMTAGLIFFTLADSSLQPDFTCTGIVLISLALCADAVIGNVQEKTLKQFTASNSEMVFYSYTIGFLYILFGLLLTNGLVPAVQFSTTHAKEIYGLAVIFSLTGYLGVNCVLILVRTSGALMAVTVTTFRKALSIVLSFLFFAKPFTMQYVWSGLVVLVGVALNVYSKNYQPINKWARSTWYSSRQLSPTKQVV